MQPPGITSHQPTNVLSLLIDTTDSRNFCSWLARDVQVLVSSNFSLLNLLYSLGPRIAEYPELARLPIPPHEFLATMYEIQKLSNAKADEMELASENQKEVQECVYMLEASKSRSNCHTLFQFLSISECYRRLYSIDQSLAKKQNNATAFNLFRDKIEYRKPMKDFIQYTLFGGARNAELLPFFSRSGATPKSIQKSDMTRRVMQGKDENNDPFYAFDIHVGDIPGEIWSDLEGIIVVYHTLEKEIDEWAFFSQDLTDALCCDYLGASYYCKEVFDVLRDLYNKVHVAALSVNSA